jgi:hypothetical protein
MSRRFHSVKLWTICLAAVPAVLSAEIIDRIAVTVDDTVITESHVLLRIRLAAFQNGEKPDFSPQKKRDAADKLVEQILIRREIESAKYPASESPDIEPAIIELKKRYGGDSGFQKALAEYNVTEQEVRDQLKWQLTLIPFIDVRFKPGVQIPERDLREFYAKTFVPEWQKTGQGTPPSFEDSRESIEETMTGQRADQALDFWLGEARRQARIKFHPEAFR